MFLKKKKPLPWAKKARWHPSEPSPPPPQPGRGKCTVAFLESDPNEKVDKCPTAMQVDDQIFCET
jgi:hypothetical protein